jgi:cystathionine beta-lyase
MGEAFSKSTDWLEAAIELNRKSLHLFMDLMAKHLPNVKYWVPKAGYLVWLDVSSLKISENPALTIIDEQRVSFVPGVDHGKNYGQYLRINFACHPESLEKAVMALAAYAK